MSGKMVDQTRPPLALVHKDFFAYESSSRELLAVRRGGIMGPVMGRATRQNFGNIRVFGRNSGFVLAGVDPFCYGLP
jgi:hypothetical protein